MAKKKKMAERYTYRYAIPLLTLVTVIAAILIWNYTADVFGDTYKGYAEDGRTHEVALAFLKEPVVILSLLALICFNAASFASVRRAIRQKHPGALLFLFILIITIVAFAAIMYTAVMNVAA